MNQLRELTMKYEGQNKSLQNKVNELHEKLLDLEVKISENYIKKIIIWISIIFISQN